MIRSGFSLSVGLPVRIVRTAVRAHRFSIVLVWLVLALVAGAGLPAWTQARPDVIVGAIDAARPVALANHHPLWANADNDLGALAPQDPVDHVTLVLARSAAQEAALQQLLADQQNPASPLYHRWLTPQQMGERFGLSDNDLQSLTAWLQSNGLQVDWVSPSRIFLSFSGTASAVNNAFQSELHTYRIHGEQRIALNSEAYIPAALAPAIRAVRGLFTLQASPNLIARVESASNPQLNISDGNGVNDHFLSPVDFSTIYSLSGPSGHGQTIGIVGRSRINVADFDNFTSQTETMRLTDPTEVVPAALGGVDPGPAYTAPPTGTVSLGDQSETTLDVERAGSTAPYANLLLAISASTANTDGLDYATQYLIQTSPVPAQIINISYGACESAAGSSGVAFWDALFQQAAGEGISVFVSSGDSGASACDKAFVTPPASPAANSINYICASSYATCVGGTEFNDASNPSLYWNSYNTSNLSSARGYIPEGAWNEPLDSKSQPIVAATGGGVSAYVATPAWQTGTGVPAARTGRYTPDVSFNAASHDGYFGCMAAAGGSCVTDSSGSTPFMIFGGTSAAAPSMAGVAAVLNQWMGTPQGNLNPNLYKTAQQSPTAFNDVTLASSGVASCNVKTPSMCNNSVPGPSGLSGGQAGYLVGTGYDEATGLGSLNIDNFLQDYAGKIVTTITVSSPGTFAESQDIDLGFQVSGGDTGSSPSGTIVVSVGGYTSQPGTLTYGSTSVTIPAYTLPVGQTTLTATYTPDSASYAGSTATFSVQITIPVPAVAAICSPNPATVTQPITTTVTVSGHSGDPVPTGSVVLSDTMMGLSYYTSSPVTLVNGSATIIVPAESIPTGDVLSIAYTPDTASSTRYTAAWGEAYVELDLSTPTVTVSPATSTVASTDPLAVTVTVDGGKGNPTPEGSVTLASGSYNATAILKNGSVLISVPGGTLTAGIDTLQATYWPVGQSPSHNFDLYASTSGSVPVGVTVGSKLPPGVTLLVGSFTSPTQPIPLTVSVAGMSGMPTPTGMVVFSAGSYASAAVPLVNGSASFNIPGATLPVGSETILATYTPDASGAANYTSSANSIYISINGLSTSTTLSVSTSSITPGQSLTFSATVTGTSGNPTPTGTVTLTAYLYTAVTYTASSPLQNGSVTFTVPGGSLSVGQYYWVANYVPDANSAILYVQSTSPTLGVAVTTSPAGISLTGMNINVHAGATTGNTSTITITPSNGFTGNVMLTAALVSGPTGYSTTYQPTFSFGNTSPCAVSGTSACTATLTVTTTAASTSAMSTPLLPWYAPGGTALAGLLLVVMGKTRRRWLSFFALLMAITLAGAVCGCGGGGGSGGNSSPTNPVAGTTPGTYTAVVTGNSGSVTAQATVLIVVQ